MEIGILIGLKNSRHSKLWVNKMGILNSLFGKKKETDISTARKETTSHKHLANTNKSREKILNPDYGNKPISFSEFKPIKNISSEEFDRQSQEIAIGIARLVQGENTPFPAKIPSINTKSLNKEGVSVVLDFLKDGAYVLLYGSYSMYFQVFPKYRRTPRDINLMLNTDRAEAEAFTDELFDKLKKAGQNVRISPYWQFHIQSLKHGKWVIAVDIHFIGISKMEPEWAYYPKEDLSRGKTEKDAKLIDMLDTYALLLNFREIFKKDPSKKLKLKDCDRIISLYKEHFNNIVDFGNLRIKGHPDLSY